MRKMISLFCAVLLCISLAVPILAADDDTGQSITVTVNGLPVQWTDAAPFIDENSRTMVPLRAVAEAMALSVYWDGESGEASFASENKCIWFGVNNSEARYEVSYFDAMDGGLIPMDTSAVIVNDRTYAPIRYLAEFFDYQVDWVQDTLTVSITRTPQKSQPTQESQPAHNVNWDMAKYEPIIWEDEFGTITKTFVPPSEHAGDADYAKAYLDEFWS